MPLREPYTIAYETVSAAVNIILKLTTSTGLTGWGCAAPDLVVTGETPESVLTAANHTIIPLLRGGHPFRVARIHEELRQRIPGARSAMAMTDMALHDLLARQAGIPLWRLLGGFRESISTSITIGIMTPEETVERAGRFLNDGFTILKLKGGADLAEDIRKVLLVRRKYGNGFSLRFDANQGYSYDEAVEFVRATSEADIEILEQPTARAKEERMGMVTRDVDIPVMADESIRSLQDAFRLVSRERIDMVNIKIMKVGGILEAAHINSVSRAAGMEVMVGCLDECALGISAGLHFALSRPNIEFADLDGHLDLLNDPFDGLFRLQNGVLTPTDDPGLGAVRL